MSVRLEVQEIKSRYTPHENLNDPPDEYDEPHEHTGQGSNADRSADVATSSGTPAYSPYHVGMTRRDDPKHLHEARRTAIRDRLTSSGMDRDVANRWCDAWETEAALRDLKRDGDYWEAGHAWIDRQCAARKQPPN